jgi:hypothetical protein
MNSSTYMDLEMKFPQHATKPIYVNFNFYRVWRKSRSVYKTLRKLYAENENVAL